MVWFSVTNIDGGFQIWLNIFLMICFNPPAPFFWNGSSPNFYVPVNASILQYTYLPLSTYQSCKKKHKLARKKVLFVFFKNLGFSFISTISQLMRRLFFWPLLNVLLFAFYLHKVDVMFNVPMPPPPHIPPIWRNTNIPDFLLTFQSAPGSVSNLLTFFIQSLTFST